MKFFINRKKKKLLEKKYTYDLIAQNALAKSNAYGKLKDDYCLLRKKLFFFERKKNEEYSKTIEKLRYKIRRNKGIYKVYCDRLDDINRELADLIYFK